MTDARLKSIADRIDRLEEERKALAGDVADVFKEAKGHGYNTKALRRVLAERRKPTDETLAADMEMYRAALGMPGATYRSVAEQFGVSKSKLQRLVPHATNGTAHDLATGEVHESSGGVEGHAVGGNDPDDSTLRPVTGTADQTGGEPVLKSGPLDTQPEDTLEIPAHLKRVKAA